MPDELQEGGLDPNNDSDFATLLAQKFGEELPAEEREAIEQRDASIESGLTQESPARDEKGRFAAAAQEPEGTAPEEGQAAPDPLAELLARYETPEQAVEALAKERDDAQSFAGRQSNEVGDLRAQLAELRGQLDGFQKAQAQAPRQAPAYVPPDQIESSFANEIGSGGTGDKTMAWVVENTHPSQIDEAVRVWHNYDPIAATAFATRREWYLMQQASEGQREAQPPSQQEIESRLGDAVAEVKTSYSEPLWNFIKPHIDGVVEADDIIKRDLISPDPSTQKNAFLHAVQLAEARAIVAQTAKAKQEEATKLEAAKQAASVGTGSLKPERESGAPTSNLDEFYKRFREADNTSVATGMTYDRR